MNYNEHSKRQSPLGSEVSEQLWGWQNLLMDTGEGRGEKYKERRGVEEESNRNLSVDYRLHH